MEVIIKATSVCNFACTFCSAAKLQLHKARQVPNKIVEMLNILQPDAVIITGGDPLCVDRQYYQHLLSLGDYPISLTTNLKAYYQNREYWKPIINNPRIGIATSFQYGNQRMWDSKTVYTEQMFTDVMTTFYSDFNYMPVFIAVICPDNIDKALDHVRLAKRLQTKCKLNGLEPVGRSSAFVPLYKMIDIWDAVYQQNLQDFVQWDPQFTSGGCNWNTNHSCQTCIRSMWVDKDNNLHYGHCETLLEGICGHQPQQIELDVQRPKQTTIHPQINQLISIDCLNCELYSLCNGCVVNREVAKCTPNFCSEMKKRKDIILSHRTWALNPT